MKILFYIESLRSGGKERRLVELIKSFSDHPDFEMALVLTTKEIHYTEINDLNVKIYYTCRNGLKKDPRIFRQFYKIAKNFKPDILHVWGNLVAIYAIPTKLIFRIPMINNQIANAPQEMANAILSHRLSFPFSTKIVANSKAGLKAYNAPKKKSMVIYNGFDFNRLKNLSPVSEIRKKFQIKTKKVVGMVASFSDKKDYKTYIEATNIILEKFTDVTFLCVGSGDATKYKKMVNETQKDKVLFLGRQENVEHIMNVCDIGVLATYTEGISNAILEFMALGKPVVTTFGGGNIELVDQANTGYLVNVSQPIELSNRISELLENDDLSRTMGQKSIERVKSKFSIEKMHNDFLALYKSVVK